MHWNIRPLATAVLLALASVVRVGPVSAQRHALAFRSSATAFQLSSLSNERIAPAHRLAPAESTGGRAVAMAAGGIVGGLVGFGAGFLAGSLVTDDMGEGMVYALAGESFLLPLGVHLANGARGQGGLSTLASIALGGVGLLLASADAPDALILTIPFAQLAASITIESRTTPAR